MILYTIGFTKKSAEAFFEALRCSGARHLFDIRLRNSSQLAGFTKRNDLRYFLGQIANMAYHEVPILAPTKSLIDEYRKTGNWGNYERDYLELIRERQVERHLEPAIFAEGVVLLCSEAEPTHCHRRLAAEYLTRAILSDAHIEHL